MKHSPSKFLQAITTGASITWLDVSLTSALFSNNIDTILDFFNLTACCKTVPNIPSLLERTWGCFCINSGKSWLSDRPFRSGLDNYLSYIRLKGTPEWYSQETFVNNFLNRKFQRIFLFTSLDCYLLIWTIGQPVKDEHSFCSTRVIASE